MSCFSPVQGFERLGVTPNGKFAFTTNHRFARKVNGKPVVRTVPCRHCEGCRNAYARQWAVKICHEAQLNFDGLSFNNSFITLTYDDDHIPAYGALDYKGHWTNFLKRLRLAVPNPIRFYMIGEYGDLNLRPHYHAIIFGFNFPDREYFSTRHGNIIYRSPLLESLWTVPRGQFDAGSSYGFSSIGDVTYASAAYVARYSMKKQIGKNSHSYVNRNGEIVNTRYVRTDPVTGDDIIVPRERALMSNGGGNRSGGIGKEWFDRYAKTDMYIHNPDGSFKDSTHMANGLIVRPPAYYDKLLERVNPELLEHIKLSRQDHMLAHAKDFTPDALRQRRECFLGKLQHLKREIRNVYK